MRLGGPVFGGANDPEQWALQHKQLGYSAAYLPGESIAQSMPYADAAKRHGIVVAEVGAWSNPLSADEQERRKALDLCIIRLDLAERTGARCCVNISGARGSQWDGPDARNLTDETFDMIVQLTRQIIDAVKPRRAFYTLETMPWAYPDSADSYVALLKAIDRPQFGVHMDVVNLVNCPARAYRTGDLIRECFAKLGPHIKSCHGKDIRLDGRLTVHLDECIPGEGLIDYGAYLTELNRLDPDTPLMLEHLAQPEQYDQAAKHVRAVAAATKVAIL